MRYFLFILIFGTALVMITAGKRGDTARKPPIEIFPDMDRQPKLRPQARNNFFADGLSSRLPVAGTIVRGQPLEMGGAAVRWDNQPVFAYQDSPVNSGRMPGTTNFIETIPVPVTEQLMSRGRQRFQIYCSPCHGAQGDGNGITRKYGMTVVANLHELRIVAQTDGEIFNTITVGKNLMGAYGPNVPVGDRWAIIAYLRALQRSRVAAREDIPASMRGQVPNLPPAAGGQTNPPAPARN
jgi:mono/diheme cytochrome c family protein